MTTSLPSAHFRVVLLHVQGTLLDKPVTEKETETETGNNGLEFGASAMQVGTHRHPEERARDEFWKGRLSLL